jgi:hypothetical protein
MKHRALKSMFKGPWRMAIQNFGRTAAYSSKVEWGMCPGDVFPVEISVSELLDSPELERVEWRCRYVKEPITIQDIFGPTEGEPLHYRHIEIEDRDTFLGWVFFGRVTYKDVFKDEHFTTFSHRLVEEHSDGIGKSLTHDHS